MVQPLTNKLSPAKALIEELKPIFPKTEFREQWGEEEKELAPPRCVVFQTGGEPSRNYAGSSFLGKTDSGDLIHRTGVKIGSMVCHYYLKRDLDYTDVIDRFEGFFNRDFGKTRDSGGRITVKTGQKPWENVRFYYEKWQLASSERTIARGERRVIFFLKLEQDVIILTKGATMTKIELQGEVSEQANG